MKETYKAGQLVYTTKDIRGWFDKSMKSFIPVNTPGTIVLLHSTATELYLVRFDGEFSEYGEHIIRHIDLRLG